MENDIILEKFAKRFSTLISENNTDITFLLNQLGIKSKSTIYRYMNGEMAPKVTTVKILSDIFNVNPLWLMGYDVPKEIYKVESNAFPTSDIPTAVPVLGKISAGLPILAVENIEGYEFAPSTYLKSDYEYFYLRVQGDSMNLRFPEGNLVLVQKQDTLEDGEIGVFLIDGQDATVKKYRRDGNFVILDPMSTNPSNITQIYNTKEIPVKIIGKVILHIGKV